MNDDAETAIIDYTSRGTYWDPLLNSAIYNLSGRNQEIESCRPPDASTSWFGFQGYWGDQEYKSQDKRQGLVCDQVKWGNGPTFAIQKNLERVRVGSDKSSPSS